MILTPERKKKFNKRRQATKILKSLGFDVYQIHEGQGFDLLSVRADEVKMIKVTWPPENPSSVPIEPDGPVKKEVWHFSMWAHKPEIIKLNKFKSL